MVMKTVEDGLWKGAGQYERRPANKAVIVALADRMFPVSQASCPALYWLLLLKPSQQLYVKQVPLFLALSCCWGKHGTEKLSHFLEEAEPGSHPIFYLLPCKVGTSDALCPNCHRVAAAQDPSMLTGAHNNSPPHVPPLHSLDPLSVLHTACARQGNGLCLS